MSDKEDAKKWRLRQAEELLKLFEEDTGSPATSNQRRSWPPGSPQLEASSRSRRTPSSFKKRTIAKIEEQQPQAYPSQQRGDRPSTPRWSALRRKNLTYHLCALMKLDPEEHFGKSPAMLRAYLELCISHPKSLTN